MTPTPAKDFFRKTYSLEDGGLLSYLKLRPEADLTGHVYRSSSHSVHERSTDVSFDARGFDDPATGAETPLDIRALRLLDKLEADMTERMIAWNKEIYHELEAEYEQLTSDDNVAYRLKDQGELYTADGEDAPAICRVSQLPDNVKARVLAKTGGQDNPEETVRNLDAEGALFDSGGNRVQDGEYVPFDKLDASAQKSVLERNRYLDVEDRWWSEDILGKWKARLESYGFNGVDIAYSGFYSQGDGASFTASSIDFPKYLSAPWAKSPEPAVESVVSRLLGVFHGVPVCS